MGSITTHAVAHATSQRVRKSQSEAEPVSVATAVAIPVVMAA